MPTNYQLLGEAETMLARAYRFHTQSYAAYLRGITTQQQYESAYQLLLRCREDFRNVLQWKQASPYNTTHDTPNPNPGAES